MKHNTKTVRVKGVNMLQCKRCGRTFGIADEPGKCPGRGR
jgi:hypothetical protein